MTVRWPASSALTAYVLLALLTGPGADLHAQEISVEAIAAIVGDEAITFAQLERRLNRRIELIGGRTDSFARTFAARMGQHRGGAEHRVGVKLAPTECGLRCRDTAP